MAISGEKKVKLTPEAILSLISSYDVFKYYMGAIPWKLNQICHSPFRDDKNPSFMIGTKQGGCSFIDFADDSKKGNCFRFVGYLYPMLSFDEVLAMIDRDFDLGLHHKTSTQNYKQIVKQYKQPEFNPKKYALIQVKTRKFTKEELDYWNMFHQDINDLKAENVYSIDQVFLNKRKFSLSPLELRFGYFYEGCWKIYRPFVEKKFKWLPNNVPITAMDGKLEIIKSGKANIQKSKKDYMVMKKLLPGCCAVQNEGSSCFSEDNIKFIKSNSKEQTLFFDSDETGVKNSLIITEEFGFNYCNVPKIYLEEGIKDFADLARVHGMNTIEKYLKEKQLI
jgi:hypothetical protein